MKKMDIIRTAETLFCRYGYEATSIQDILDALHTSKGSFYHHFASKESLLEEICRNRVSDPSGEAATGASPAEPTERLDLLYREMIPFTGEKLSFLMMILPVFDLPEGTSLRVFYEKELTRRYCSEVAEVLRTGTATGSFFCTDALCAAEISLLLVNNLWLKLCDMIILCEKNGNIADPGEMMNLIRQYRISVERLLGAPYGSLKLISLPELQFLTEQIHLHWKR